MKTVKINIDEIGIFRKAESKDIAIDNMVFLVGDGNNLIRMNIDEVLRPNDPYKAFMFDGCRYGLEGLYVLISGSELQSKVNGLQAKIDLIKEIL